MTGENGEKLYSIGEVSKICNVSKKALRYYDEIGIISPDVVSSNYYRYYSRKSLLDLTIVKYYKQMGFKLEEMRNLLSSEEYRIMERGFLKKINELQDEQTAVMVKLTSVTDWYELLVEAQTVIENDVRDVSIRFVETKEYGFMDQDYIADDMEAIINLQWTDFLESIGNEITGAVNIVYPSWKERVDEYLDKDDREARDAMAQFGLERNIPKMKSDLERYGIHYDKWFMESDLHQSGYVAETVAALTEKGYTYEKDGALWLKTAEILAEGYRKQGKSEKAIEKLELKDDVLRRANGFYTYFAADIAYHRNKLEERGFDKAVNIWGADHHGHVARLKGALDALGLNGQERLEIVLMQLVKLTRGGEVVRMSKRTGKAISLTDLLDEVPVDAARYFFNSRPESPVEFDLELAVRNDSENPVYYVQYAHARICTMIENLKADGHTVPEADKVHGELLTAEEEKALIRQLAELPNEITAAAREYDPSRINRYVTALATKFHKFYTECRIKGEEEDLLQARLYLADITRKVLALSLGIVGVSAPEKM